MMTTATDRLIVTASFMGITVRSGKLHAGSPGSTAASVWIPQSRTGRTRVITAPAAISTTAIGNFGMNFLDSNRITSAETLSATDGRLMDAASFAICSASSRNSPVPAVPPISFGSCIKMIVVQIPVIKPPITGAEM